MITLVNLSINFILLFNLLVLVHQFESVLSTNNTITECRTEQYVFDDIDRRLILHCATNSSTDLTSAIHANATLNCANKSIKVTDVQIIRLEKCEFSSIPHGLFRSFKTIRELDISDLSLKKLEKDDIVDLVKIGDDRVTLYLSNNKLIDIVNGTFDQQQALEYLYLDWNRLKHLNFAVFSGLSRLKYLNLAHNEIVEIPPEAFSQLMQLETIDLYDNQIDVIGEAWFPVENQLKQLNLYKNNIVELKRSHFKQFQSVIDLQLGDNEISVVPTQIFEDLTQLENLNLRSNHIRSVTGPWFSAHNQLINMYLANNSIVELTPSSFTHLHHLDYLDLQSNGIVHLPDGVFHPLTKLTFLNLDQNPIYSIGTFWFGTENNLAVLYASYNNITELKRRHFLDLTHLVILAVSHSNVGHIENETFYSTQKLTSLDLSHNCLKEFNVSALFTSTANVLSILNLDENQLMELSQQIDVILPELKRLSMEHNQFNCSYLKALEDTLKERNQTNVYQIGRKSCD